MSWEDSTPAGRELRLRDMLADEQHTVSKLMDEVASLNDQMSRDQRCRRDHQSQGGSMTDKITITGPNRLVLMDVILGAFAGEHLPVELECEEEFLTTKQISKILNSDEWEDIKIEVEL